MKTLKDSWLTDGLIDFEYKKYILLSYLKNVEQSFNKNKLYPSMADLVFHYKNLLAVKNNKELLSSNFPSQITGVNLKKLEIVYKEMVKDDEMMDQLSDIIEYAIPMFKNSLDQGKEIYEFVESNCELSPVGLLPLYVDEGYLFINTAASSDTSIYRYQLTLIQQSAESYRGIHVSFIENTTKVLGESYESLKVGMARKFKDLPNPATFIIHSKLHFPYVATLVPVAKRLLVRYVAST
ncbi:hypothetical protein FNH22_29655 [Fulvivirga sp. M361]|uniref:hypothetical protein n=1 Tax=Fulvivirga sp. M361 TaxID=2594266 RepID=UPI00117BA090|nr:hypothetical protein [Fulvivirga sp. M361]TRX48128.1 hypothetical protein FNH22_29655 [Fulvivirga sp. M361]